MPQSVDELQSHVSIPFHPSFLLEPYGGVANPQGINVADITKLKAAGIVTVLGVAQTTRKNLAKIKVGSESWMAR
jgi:hypothetical protein